MASTISVVAENLAVVLMWFGNWYSFYIVQKEVPGMESINQPSMSSEEERQPLTAEEIDNQTVHTV